MNVINVNTAELVELTDKLERLSKSAMPIAVRGALNDAAFEAKDDAIKQFKRNFIIRRETFIKSHMIAVKSPNTFKLSEMVTLAGVKQGKTTAGDRLKIQEEGGYIYNRSVPTDETRASAQHSARQQAKFYYRKFRNSPKGHYPSQRGVKVKSRPKQTILKTDNRVVMITKGGDWKTLYYLDKKVRITENAFILPAGVRTSKKLHRLYRERARTQFARLINK